jgi:ketosteroid isomerase-like protein
MSLAQQFMDALKHLDQTGDVEPIARLFRDDAPLRRMAQHHSYRPDTQGPDQIRAFWQDYRSAFDRIHTEFHDAQTTDGRVFLEWTSEGTLSNGTPFGYDGISILETDGDRVAAFRAYYDSAELYPRT